MGNEGVGKSGEMYTVQYITEEGDVRGGKRDGSDKGV